MEIIEPNHSKVHFCSQEEVVQRMKENGCYEKFEELSRQGRRELIDFCTGKTLLPLTYDKIFKKVFNCEKHPERLEHFLSSILGFEVKILTILPTESEQMNKEGSILIMDILVKSTDGKLLNVEMQRLPYSFNGKRVSCYMADLVMRQYNQIKSELKRKKFTYSMLKPVYCIVLFEKSGGAMSDLPDIWEDRGKIVFDSGLEEEFLENIHYIELDKFRKNVQTITNEKECWLSLFSADTPEKIQQVMSVSQEMFDIVLEVAEYAAEIEEVIDMFSEALRILDRNTEQYMIDQAVQEIEELKEARKEYEEQLEKYRSENEKRKEQLEKYRSENEECKEQLERYQSEREEQKEQLEKYRSENEECKEQLERYQSETEEQKEQLKKYQNEREEQKEQLKQMEKYKEENETCKRELEEYKKRIELLEQKLAKL